MDMAALDNGVRSGEASQSEHRDLTPNPAICDNLVGSPATENRDLPCDLRSKSQDGVEPPRHSSEFVDAAKIAEIKKTIREAVGDTVAKQTWTFSSSGWLFVYFFGVIKALRDLDRQEGIYVVGSSGGSCAGAFTFLHDAEALDQVVEYIKSCARKARSGNPADLLRIRTYVQGAVRSFMTDDAARAVSNRMEISVSKLQNPLTHWPPWPLKNVRIKTFESEQALEDAVLASACVWPFPPQYVAGVGWCIDGVYSDSELISGIFLGRPIFTFHRKEQYLGPAVSVCPFYMSRADICPSEFINPGWAAIPPGDEALDRLYKLGYKDCMAWLMVKEHSEVGLPAWAHSATSRGQPSSSAGGAESSEGMAASADLVAGRIQEACQAVSKRVARTVESMKGVSTSLSAAMAEAAQSAVGCDAAAEEVMTGTVTGFRKLVSLIAWGLIIAEMFLQSCLAGAVATWSPLLPGSNTKTAWVRFAKVTSTMLTPKLFLKALPALGPHIDLEAKANRPFARALREHSFLYRLFYYLLY